MRWIAWLLVAACSSGTAPRGPLPPPPPDDRPPAHPGGPTERECDELITHAVSLGIDERVARANEPRTTEADHEAIRRKLHEEFMTGCRQLSRDAYACAIASRTLSELSACQASASSSTSNSSVDPGGMTPPAPRSP
jgi:hypothetical protein